MSALIHSSLIFPFHGAPQAWMLDPCRNHARWNRWLPAICTPFQDGPPYQDCPELNQFRSACRATLVPRVASGAGLELAQGLPERGLGVFGPNQAASLQGGHETLADLIDVLAAELPLPRADQKAIAADLRHDLAEIVGHLLRRADHPVEAAG